MNELASSEEHPLNFERPEGVDVAVKVDDVARKIFRADGMLSALLKKMRGALAMHAVDEDRGPDPDVPIYRPVIRKEKPPVRKENAALWVSIASLMITLGGIVFWTGRFTAQADMYQQLQAKQSSDIKSNTDANAKQDVTLGVIGQQYLEISRRLNSIEGKLDERH